MTYKGRPVTHANDDSVIYKGPSISQIVNPNSNAPVSGKAVAEYISRAPASHVKVWAGLQCFTSNPVIVMGGPTKDFDLTHSIVMAYEQMVTIYVNLLILFGRNLKQIYDPGWRDIHIGELNTLIPQPPSYSHFTFPLSGRDSFPLDAYGVIYSGWGCLVLGIDFNNHEGLPPDEWEYNPNLEVHGSVSFVGANPTFDVLSCWLHPTLYLPPPGIVVMKSDAETQQPEESTKPGRPAHK
jgi:hypothetical protein